MPLDLAGAQEVSVCHDLPFAVTHLDNFMIGLLTNISKTQRTPAYYILFKHPSQAGIILQGENVLSGWLRGTGMPPEYV